MATRRTDIMNAFITHIADSTTIEEPNITRRYHVLGEVNDFPALTMVAEGERREHRGGGRKIAIFFGRASRVQLRRRWYGDHRSGGDSWKRT